MGGCFKGFRCTNTESHSQSSSFFFGSHTQLVIIGSEQRQVQLAGDLVTWRFVLRRRDVVATIDGLTICVKRAKKCSRWRSRTRRMTTWVTWSTSTVPCRPITIIIIIITTITSISTKIFIIRPMVTTAAMSTTIPVVVEEVAAATAAAATAATTLPSMVATTAETSSPRRTRCCSGELEGWLRDPRRRRSWVELYDCVTSSTRKKTRFASFFSSLSLSIDLYYSL